MGPKKKEEEEDGELKAPDGCVPLSLTGATQEMFGVKAKVDVTESSPFKPISKDAILKDIQFRGAISCFQPLKAKIEKSALKEIVVFYDAEFSYGESYVVILTDGGREAMQKAFDDLHPQAAAGTAAPSVEGVEGAPSDVPAEEAMEVVGEYHGLADARPWESLGSEAEITETTVTPNRELLVVSISRKRREFGLNNFKFADTEIEYNEYRQFREGAYELRRMQIDKAVQNVETTQEMHTQTAWFRRRNACIQYKPLEMDAAWQQSHVDSEAMTAFLGAIEPLYTTALQQNETFDIMSNDFEAMIDEDFSLGNKNENHVREFISYTTPSYIKKRVVSAIDWLPGGDGIVGVSCCDRLNLDDRIELDGKVRNSYLLLWNFADPILPQYMCEAPSDLYCFRYNPADPNIIAAGCVNGQVFLYDLTQTTLAYQMDGTKRTDDDDASTQQTIPMVKVWMSSAIDLSHKQAVTDISWISSKFQVAPRSGKVTDAVDNKTQLISIGADGAVLIWDSTRLTSDGQWGPIVRVNLTNLDGTGELSGSRISIDHASGDSRFYCATEEGDLVFADWQMRESDEQVAEHVLSCSTAHYGAIHSLERSPFFADILLTVGDWTFHIWKAGIQEPIVSSPHANSYLKAGRWSPTRPGVLVTAKVDGWIDIWDLLDRSHEPSMTTGIGSDAIVSMEFWNSKGKGAQAQQLLAIGDDQGYLHVMDIPRNFRKSTNAQEKQIMAAFFEREVKRVEYQKSRLDYRRNELTEKKREVDQKREKELEEEEKRRHAAEQAVQAQEAAASGEEERKKSAEEIREEEAEAKYKELEKKFCAALGIDTEGNPLSEEELAKLQMDSI